MALLAIEELQLIAGKIAAPAFVHRHGNDGFLADSKPFGNFLGIVSWLADLAHIHSRMRLPDQPKLSELEGLIEGTGECIAGEFDAARLLMNLREAHSALKRSYSTEVASIKGCIADVLKLRQAQDERYNSDELYRLQEELSDMQRTLSEDLGELKAEYIERTLEESRHALVIIASALSTGSSVDNWLELLRLCRLVSSATQMAALHDIEAADYEIDEPMSPMDLAERLYGVPDPRLVEE